MYRVGDRVKVFMDCFSLHTEKGIICNVKFLPDKNEFIYLVGPWQWGRRGSGWRRKHHLSDATKGEK